MTFERAPFILNRLDEPAVLLQRSHPDTRVNEVVERIVSEVVGDAPSALRYAQRPTQGRSCFVDLPRASLPFAVEVKGVGRGAGSSRFLQRMEMRMRGAQRADALDIFHIWDEGAFPFAAAAFRNDSERQYALLSPFRVGFSPLTGILREYVMSTTVFEPNRISPTAAIACGSHRPRAPWAEGDEAQVIVDDIIRRFRTILADRDDPSSDWDVYAEPMSSLQLDGGFLVRTNRSLVRFQEIFDPALQGEWVVVQDLLRVDPSTAIENLVHHDFVLNLARTASRLLRSGVVHGQLYYLHAYQNITYPYADLCDFDHAVVSPYSNSDLHDRVQRSCKEVGNETGVDLLEVNGNMEALYVSSPEHAANTMIEETYCLFNTALRFVDLVARSRKRDRTSQGTILPASVVSAFRSSFIHMIADDLDSPTFAALAHARIPAEGHRFSTFDGLVSGLEATAIQGWTNRRRPLNCYDHVTANDDGVYTTREFANFAQQLLECRR